MTREEAKSCIGTVEMLQRLAYNIHGVMDVIDADNCKKIIKALEQEPTTKNDLGVDCISRAEVIEEINSVANDAWDEEQMRVELIAEINALPTVKPQEPKTGHWVHGEYCSECGCDVPAYIVDWKWQKDMDAKYCPNCGAKMIEPQESEDKE